MSLGFIMFLFLKKFSVFVALSSMSSSALAIGAIGSVSSNAWFAVYVTIFTLAICKYGDEE